MISIVTTLFNNRFDLEQLVRHLELHNDPSSFEVVVAHDNRVDDGSEAALASLQAEFSNVKSVARSAEEALACAAAAVEAKASALPKKAATGMRARLAAAGDGELVGKQRLLSIPSSALLNEAAKKAAGDFLLFVPADVLLGFSVAALETWASALNTSGLYSHLHAIPLAVTNLTEVEVQEAVARFVAQGSRLRSHPWNVKRLRRRYERWTPDLSKYLLVDASRGLVIALNDPAFIQEAQERIHYAEEHGTYPIMREWPRAVLVATSSWAGFRDHALDAHLAWCAVEKDHAAYRVEAAPVGFSVIVPDVHAMPDPFTGDTLAALHLQASLQAVDPKHADHPLPGRARSVVLHSKDSGAVTSALKADLGL